MCRLFQCVIRAELASARDQGGGHRGATSWRDFQPTAARRQALDSLAVSTSKKTTRLGGHAAVWHDVENLLVRGSRDARPAQRDRPAKLPADAGSVAVAPEA